ncbi:VOC family protein [Streptomyces netropsis]|uniref:VOC family protein n=1 Tax=Streptomyces netropsis TaxID=55404 RepID=UPI0030D62251
MAGEISFFELGVDDAERARAFYGHLFGWTFEAVSPGGGYAISTPDAPGGLHGADPGASPYLFFKVDDLDTALARVRELGGTAETPESEEDPETVARFGRFTLCRDDQGSPFGLHQPPAGDRTVA